MVEAVGCLGDPPGPYHAADHDAKRGHEDHEGGSGIIFGNTAVLDRHFDEPSRDAANSGGRHLKFIIGGLGGFS